MTAATRADVCVVACADAWRGDGERLASPFGVIPTIGARLARATFEPDLLLSDGEALLVRGVWPIGEPAPAGAVEGWIPFRAVMDLAYAGRRHVMMSPSQLDRHGNSNISCIGDFARPTVQLIGVRGAPMNTANHATSYWVPRHTPRALVEQVDMVCGIGRANAIAAGPGASRFHDLRRVVTNLGVFDFGGPDGRLRLRSLHPGVTLEELAAETGFALEVTEAPPETRSPTDDELRMIREQLDPEGHREREVPSPAPVVLESVPAVG